MFFWNCLAFSVIQCQEYWSGLPFLSPVDDVYSELYTILGGPTGGALIVSLTMLNPLIMWMTTHRKIIQEMGIPDYLSCLLRNLYAGQEATIITGHGTMYWFKIGRGVCQAFILSSCLFFLYAEYIMQNTSLDEAQAETNCREKYL